MPIRRLTAFTSKSWRLRLHPSCLFQIPLLKISQAIVIRVQLLIPFGDGLLWYAVALLVMGWV